MYAETQILRDFSLRLSQNFFSFVLHTPKTVPFISYFLYSKIKGKVFDACKTDDKEI